MQPYLDMLTGIHDVLHLCIGLGRETLQNERLLSNHIKPTYNRRKCRNCNLRPSCKFVGCMRKFQNDKASNFHEDASTLLTTVTLPATTPDIKVNTLLSRNLKLC